MKVTNLCCLLISIILFSCAPQENLEETTLALAPEDCTNRTEARLEKSSEGAQYLATEATPTTFTPTQMDADVQRYWGEIEEKTFSIPFALAQRLLFVSDQKEVALHIQDMNDPDLVDADWMSFSNTARASAAPCESFFVLDHVLIASFDKAINDLAIPLEQQEIVVHLGQSVEGVMGSYFMLGETELHLVGNLESGRGVTGACGVKIPPR